MPFRLSVISLICCFFHVLPHGLQIYKMNIFCEQRCEDLEIWSAIVRFAQITSITNACAYEIALSLYIHTHAYCFIRIEIF